MRPASVDLSRMGSETPAARRRRRLAAYGISHRNQIAGLTLDWPILEDLADSFPALLFALATGYGTQATQQTATRLIGRGAPLREAAAAIGLPMWLRRIPASALGQPLPMLPTDDTFAAAILARIPECPSECGVWLDRFLLAYKLVGPEFALWAAREARFLPPATGDSDLQWLLAWGWASRHPRSPGHALLRMAWNPALGWKRAQDEIAIWKKRIDLVGALAGPARDPWFADGHALGLDIVHLDTVQDFVTEAVAMENCLDQYAAHLSYGRVRVFSVRRDGRPLADVELTLRSDETTMAAISQVRGPRNRRASPLVWQAIHAWMGAQPFRPLSPVPTPPVASRDALRQFWLPYLQAVERAGLAERFMSGAFGLGARRGRSRLRNDGVMAALRDALAPMSHQRVPAGEPGGA